MKFLRTIISLLLAVILGFWLASSDILVGTRTGDILDNIVSYLPTRNNLEQVSNPETELSNTSRYQLPQLTSLSPHSEIDFALIESTIIDLTNELRQELGVSPVERNEMLDAAATIRAVETEESFSHTRPDGTDPFTVFEEDGISYPYVVVGENLAMATYHTDEVGMAQFIFNGWVESQGHYENMIQPEYEEMGVGTHYDGEILYATQMFGTQWLNE